MEYPTILCEHSKNYLIKFSKDRKTIISLKCLETDSNQDLCKNMPMNIICYLEAIDFMWYFGSPEEYEKIITQKIPKDVKRPPDCNMNKINPSSEDFIFLLGLRIHYSDCKFSRGVKNLKKYIEDFKDNTYSLDPPEYKNYFEEIRIITKKYPYIYYPLTAINFYNRSNYKYGIISSHSEGVESVKKALGLEDLGDSKACEKLYHCIMGFINVEGKSSDIIVGSLFYPYISQNNVGDFLEQCRAINEL